MITKIVWSKNAEASRINFFNRWCENENNDNEKIIKLRDKIDKKIDKLKSSPTGIKIEQTELFKHISNPYVIIYYTKGKTLYINQIFHMKSDYKIIKRKLIDDIYEPCKKQHNKTLVNKKGHKSITLF